MAWPEPRRTRPPVTVAGLGFLADANAEAPRDLAKNAAISGLTAQSIGDSAKIASGGRWITMAVGLIALYSGGVSFVKAMRTAHALAWHERVSSLKRVWRGVGVLLAVALGAAFTVSVLARVRAGDRLIGLGPRSSSSDLYGPLGAAVALLGWAYLFGRLTVAAAMLNATLWERPPLRPPIASVCARVTQSGESRPWGIFRFTRVRVRTGEDAR